MSKPFLFAATLTALSLFALPAAAQPQARQQREPGELLLRADSNRDGKITRAEYRSAKTNLFDRLDRNRDGVLNSSDSSGRRFARRRGGGERLQQLASAMDANGDGRVERAEFVDGPSQLFDLADVDANGIIDARELATLRDKSAFRPAQ